MLVLCEKKLQCAAADLIVDFIFLLVLIFVYGSWSLLGLRYCWKKLLENRNFLALDVLPKLPN